ncbi:hypothetical protein EC915_11322 [Pseudomonas sp. LP_7_YM]|nr:hypothetical protein EC915_11322 [Pseudomonas sp. LP_7_YM]
MPGRVTPKTHSPKLTCLLCRAICVSVRHLLAAVVICLGVRQRLMKTSMIVLIVSLGKPIPPLLDLR